ncbi:hypothetical protein EGW08_015756 [Elysia chlorotica]|uniref:Uncharacterized protein n=1 Tax=Elysia chlorotica TaxID=188477 RepID=A0A3S0ZFK8_ELYCH|nr:hypothetical protein EGW08_015756 [Elysia chlorotica]
MPFLLAMALLKHLSLFYVVVFLNGIYRNILFTTPFVMATELVDGEKGHVSYELHSTGNGTTEPPACSNTSDQTPSIDLRSADGPELEDHASYGSTIAIVGAMLPLSDLVLSCMMGPLLEATSDPALPMLYGVTSGLAAALALVAIAAYKRRAGV